jgi:hypothetical protein
MLFEASYGMASTNSYKVDSLSGEICWLKSITGGGVFRVVRYVSIWAKSSGVAKGGRGGAVAPPIAKKTFSEKG